MSLNNRVVLDHWMNVTLFVFNGGSIALVALDQLFWGAIFGLLAEPAFAYFSWKARTWAMGALTAWWTVWWAVVAWRNW